MALNRRYAEPALRRDATIKHYALEGVLPSTHLLALNPTHKTLSYLIHEEGQPCMCSQVELTALHACILAALLDYYPHYCPREVAYAAYQGYYTHQAVNDETIEKSRAHLVDAWLTQRYLGEIRPVQDAITGIRKSLRPFRIDILTILRTGYALHSIDEPNMALTSPEGEHV